MKKKTVANEKIKSRDGQFLKILFLGIIVVFVCLAVCMVLIRDLKNEYNQETMLNYHEHHMSSADIINDQVANLKIDATRIAKEYVAKDPAVGRDAFYEFLEDKMAGRFYDVGYVDEFGNLYIDGEKITPDTNEEWAKNIFDCVKKTSTSTVFKGHYISTDLEGSQLMIAEPAGTGFILVIEEFSSLLYSGSLDYQNMIGQCYIIDKDMHVLGYGLNGSVIEAGNSFALAVLQYTDGSQDTKRAVQKMRTDLAERKSGYISVNLNDNSVVQISYCTIDGLEGTYFITCFNKNLSEYKIRPLLVRSMLSCLFIMFLMLLIIFYVWATSKKANITIEKLAYEDPVTGGRNLNYFKETALKIIDSFRETPFVILRFDIANFRYFNEAYGHTRADEVLASCIKNFNDVFSERELCVRITADQFLALILNDNTYDSRVDRFKELVNADARGKGIKYPVRFKTGVYQVKKSDTDIDVMIDHANVARKTLNAERNQLKAYYSDSIVTNMRKTDRMESDMRNAFSNGEFHVYFQPKWDVVSNHVAGAEALVRWNRKDGNVILPEEFIPVFEQNGFVEVLDFYTLEEVCKQVRNLFDEGRTTYPISINQSSVLLHNPDYVNNVQKILKKYNIPAGVIEIEVNEDVFDDDRESMFKMLKDLKACGVRVLLDNFGSGSASLAILKDAPFDIIKIGSEFFAEAVSNKQNLWILQKLIEMINGLGLELICEGVESNEQAVFLRNLGCRLVQGFFYSRPIPGDEYVQLFCDKYQA